MTSHKGRVLRFAVSAALIGAGPLAACGGGQTTVNETPPEPRHVNEPMPDDADDEDADGEGDGDTDEGYVGPGPGHQLNEPSP